MGEKPVALHLYDLTQGLARQMSQQLLGIYLEGVWHSGLVFEGSEYYFGGGIFRDTAGQTPYGRPDKRIALGNTTKTREEFERFLDQIRPRFRMQDYDLLRHNCNNFTNECSIFLTGQGIPQDIIDLPNRALSTPLGQMLRPQIEAYRQSVVNQYADIDRTIPAGGHGAVVPPRSHVHSHLHVPLFTLARPISHASAGLDKAVERLGQLLRESGNSLKMTKSLSDMALVAQPTSFGQNLSKEALQSVVNDLFDVLQVLGDENKYPALDIMRVVALNPQGLAAVLAHPSFQPLMRQILSFGSAQTRLSLITGLRLVQNLLLTDAAAQGPLCSPPLDAAAAKCLAASLVSDNAAVRKPAAFAAYNFACALQKRPNEDDAAMVFVSGLAAYLNRPLDPRDSYEFLSALLSLGTVLYGHAELVLLLLRDNVNKIDLEGFRVQGNDQLNMTIDQLKSILTA